MTINLIDARRGLHDKCLELFADKKIAEQIYRYLCDGIEDCEEAEPTKYGHWVKYGSPLFSEWECSECGERNTGNDFPDECPHCKARMDEVEE